MSSIRKPGWWNNQGYIQGRVWENGKKRIVLLHRFIMEKVLDRSLSSSEHVHHMDGNRQNNDPRNLEVMSHGCHSAITNKNRQRKSRPGRILGVHYIQKHRRWYAKLKVDKELFLGPYRISEKDAAIDRRILETKHKGKESEKEELS